MARGKIPLVNSFPKFSSSDGLSRGTAFSPLLYRGHERKLFRGIPYDHTPCFIRQRQ